MYDDKYVRRGEIYSVKSGEYDDATGSLSRPGLIVSSNITNSRANAVVVVFLTTNDNNIGIHYGPIMNTGRASYVCCERMMTVNKARLGKLMGSLSENQMKEVESRLDEVLDLGYVDNTPLKEKEAELEALRLQLDEVKAKNVELQKKVDAHADELITRDVEIAVHKRMYEKAVGIIAAMRAEPDMPERPNYGNANPKSRETKDQKNPESPKEPPKNPASPKPVEQKLVDINTAKFGVLRSIGLSNGVVLSVINCRPYKKIEDLKKVPGVNSSLYRIIESKICCIPVKESPKVEESQKVEEPRKVEEPMTPEVVEESPVVANEAPVVVEESPAVVVEDGTPRKVNVNTASAKELADIGLNARSAQEIVSHRKKNGDYSKLEDLLILKWFGNTCMKRYGHLLEV